MNVPAGSTAAQAATARTAVLLLTDVVDSTALGERLGDAAMAAVWAAHDRVARDLLPPWRGREIDKTDGMLLLFDSVSDAAGYALAYQRALAALPVPLAARAGLHRGPVLLRENQADDVARGAKPLEVDGLAKPTVARVMGLAAGGQLLLTPEARAAFGDPTDGGAAATERGATLPAGTSLQSHGHWQLKGLAAPIELFELRDGARPPQIPADNEKAWRMVRAGERWLPVAELPNNLPHPATSFLGRERELDALHRALRDARLVTLLGMGGLGKTRLALQLAAETRHLYPEGTWFVDLSPLRDPALVSVELAQVLGLREEPDRSLAQTLAAHLRRQRVLLVFDNCEHLLDAAAELVDVLLRVAPGLRVIASSREPLDVPGEHGYPILPLPVPDKAADATALTNNPAVQLFLARARAQRPGFSLAGHGDDGAEDGGPGEGDRGAGHVAAVASLVARLEGIPLAIELAAARLRTMRVAEIDAALARRYEVLTGGSRRLHGRQQTLRALVDWSYDLLQPVEQAVLQRLAVCVGGFDLEAAQAVCADVVPALANDADMSAPAVAASVASLAEKSLLMPRPGATPARWGMLESIRDYALDKLAAAGGQAPAAARHAQHFFALAKLGRDGLKGVQQPQWIARMESEIDNLRTAARTALDAGVDPLIAVKLATALQGFWILRGYVNEGRAVLQEALALPAVQADAVAHGHALYVAAALAGSRSEHRTARALLQQCLALRRTLGHPVPIAATLSTLAQSEMASGDAAAALSHETEALALFTEAGDALGQAIGRLHLAQCHRRLDDTAAARAELAQALALALELGSREIEGEAHRVAAVLALDAGDPTVAQREAAAALGVAEPAADRRGAADARRLLAAAALAQGDAAAARAALAQALPELLALEMREELIDAAETAARLAALLGEGQQALRAAAAADKWRQRVGLEREPRAAAAWSAWLASTFKLVSEAAARTGSGTAADPAEAARAEGQRWELDARGVSRLLAARAN